MQIETQRELKQFHSIIRHAEAGQERIRKNLGMMRIANADDAAFYAKQESDIAKYEDIIRRANERIKEIQMNTYLAAHSLDAEITIQQITDNEASFFEASN